MLWPFINGTKWYIYHLFIDIYLLIPFCPFINETNGLEVIFLNLDSFEVVFLNSESFEVVFLNSESFEVVFTCDTWLSF